MKKHSFSYITKQCYSDILCSRTTEEMRNVPESRSEPPMNWAADYLEIIPEPGRLMTSDEMNVIVGFAFIV